MGVPANKVVAGNKAAPVLSVHVRPEAREAALPVHRVWEGRSRQLF